MLGLVPKTEKVELEVVRGDKTLTISFMPREKGKVEGDQVALTRWDLTVCTINQFDNPDLYFQKKEGVFIYGIKSRGNAAGSGLQSQDILMKINGKDVKTLEEVKAMQAETVKKAEDNPRVIMTVLRNGLMRQVVLDIARDYSKE
jgi:S1-C subfamily serine protease